LIDDCQKQNNQGGVNISKLVDEINVANKYIKELVATNQRNDSLNMVLSNNLKRSLSDVASDDVQIKVQKGVVFISLSDKMLYNSGKYTLNTAAAGTLDKIAKILNDYKDYDVLVQGNTDNVPIATATIADNWDLSCLRATSVARYLQNNLNINPSRITAGGRSEYQPKVSNDTPANRSINRRTEIIVMPKLDEFMKLLEAGKK
jgi:chemotaxis protein MotB